MKAYILIGLLIAILLVPVVEAELVDFTTFFESDPWNNASSRIIKNTTTATWVGSSWGNYTYLRKDYGADYFDSDFSHNVTGKIYNRATVPSAVNWIWGLSNDSVGNVRYISDGIFAGLYWGTAPTDTVFVYYKDPTGVYTCCENHRDAEMTLNVWRSTGNIGGLSNISIDVYNDSAKTILHCGCSYDYADDSQKYRYLYAVGQYYQPTERTSYGFTHNLYIDSGALTVPVWSNNYSSTPTIHSVSTFSVFNITWNHTTDIMDNVYIETNWSGSPTNYSMDYLYSTPGGSRNRTYGYQAILPAGDFYWKSHGIVGGKTNTTDTYYFQINGTNPNMSLNATPAWNITLGETLNVSCTADVNIQLQKDGINISNPYVSSPAIGTNNYTCYVTDPGNFTYNVLQEDANINNSYSLTNCSEGIEAMYLYLYDETDTNLRVTGNLSIAFDVYYNGNYIQNNSFILANQNNFTICVTPNWSNIQVVATLEYLADNYSKRQFYFMNRTIDNTTETINLYLLPNSDTSYIQYIFLDQFGEEVEGVIAEFQKYYVGSNDFKTVGMIRSGLDGKAAMTLEYYEWYKVLLYQNNVLVKTFTSSQILTTPVYLILDADETIGYFEYYDQLSYSCGFNDVTNITSCTYADSSGHLKQMRFYVTAFDLLNGTIEICNLVSTSSSDTLTCDITGYRDRDVKYSLLGRFASETSFMNLVTEWIDKHVTGNLGVTGVLMATLLILLLALVGIYHPAVSIVLMCIGLVFTTMLGMIFLNIEFLVGIILVGALVVYKGGKK